MNSILEKLLVIKLITTILRGYRIPRGTYPMEEFWPLLSPFKAPKRKVASLATTMQAPSKKVKYLSSFNKL